jgi:hypothetical protein
MRQKGFTPLMLILIFLIGGAVLFIALNAFPRDAKFTGTITTVNNACHADAGPCSITVDDKEISMGGSGYFGPDTDKRPSGKLIGVTTSERSVGTPVEVFVKKKFFNSYTIRGKTDYYIKALE